MKSRSNNWGDVVPWTKRMGERTFSMGIGEKMLPGRGAKLAAEVQWAQPSSRHSSPSPAITKSNTLYDSQQTLVPPGASQYDSQMTLVPYGDSQMSEYDEMSPQPMEDSPVLLSQPQNSHQDPSRDKLLSRPFAPKFNRPPMIPRPSQQQQQQQLNKHNQANQRGLRARSPVFENLKSLAAGGERQAAPNWKERGQHTDISKVISTMRASTKSPGEDEIQRIVSVCVPYAADLSPCGLPLQTINTLPERDEPLSQADDIRAGHGRLAQPKSRRECEEQLGRISCGISGAATLNHTLWVSLHNAFLGPGQCNFRHEHHHDILLPPLCRRSPSLLIHRC